jgi:hypothetical protein
MVLALAVSVPTLLDALRDLCPASDFALLELSTDQAAHWSQLLGPYSRFGWRHPGPAYFYLLAPPYGLSARHSASLPVGALLLNAGVMLAMATVLRRQPRGWPMLLVAGPLVLAYSAYLGPGFLYNIWNPAVTVLPLALFLILCAATACGQLGALAPMAALGSFLVQTHIGYLPCVLAALATCLLGLRAGGHGQRLRAVSARIGLATLVLVALWAPPVYEELTRTPGNLTLIARFFAGSGGGVGLGAAIAVVSREVVWWYSHILFGPLAMFEGYPPLGGARLVLAETLALVHAGLLALLAARPSAAPFTRALARVCLAGMLVSVPAVMRITTEVRPYMIIWISGIGAVGLLPILSALLAYLLRGVAADAHRERRLARIATLLLALSLATPVALAPFPARGQSQFPAAREMSDAIVERLRRRGARRAQVKITPGESEPGDVFFGAAAILLQLHKSGIAFAVERDWWNFFGDRWLPTGDEDALIDFYLERPGRARPPLICRPSGDHRLCVRVSDLTD